jgi:hypothetical protein
VVVLVSDPQERLLGAWGRLVEHWARVMESHWHLHVPSGGGQGDGGQLPVIVRSKTSPGGQDGFTITLDATCQPAYVAPGEVRVGVVAQAAFVPMPPNLPVDQLREGTLQLAAYQAAVPTSVPPGQGTVVVSLDVNNPVGCYAGRLTEPTGVGAPFIIFLDGLPPPPQPPNSP